MSLAAITLYGANNTKYVIGGIDRLQLDPKNLTVHLCDDWYLNAREITGIGKISVFAGNKKEKKKGAWSLASHKKTSCYLNVINVRKMNGWLFFCDSRDNYMLLQEELRGEVSKDGSVKISNKLFDCIKDCPGMFLHHVGMAHTYKTQRSKEVTVGEKWVDDECGMPVLEKTHKMVHYYETYSPGDSPEDFSSQCLCVEPSDFDRLYDFLMKVQAAAAEQKRAEEEIRWNQRKRKKVEQLRLDRRRKTPEQLEEERRRRAAGRMGEREVEYVIKWLTTEGYCSVPKKPCVKYDDEAILLWNPDFIDEPQEYDHIVLGPQGVFLIETKNFRGTLAVNRNGNWIRIKDGVEEGVPSPVQQVRRHEKLLRSILPEKIPIIPIICVAHPEVIIKGADNCTVPLVKSDMLGDYIENRKKVCLLEEDVQNCVTLIEKYRLEE